MDLTYPPEAEDFRREVRAWLDAHVTAQWRDLGYDLEGPPAWVEAMRDWNRLLADAGYAAIAWPVEYGGRGAGPMEQVVFGEEMHRARAPGTLNPIGISNIAPSIIQFGTDVQKQRFLGRMLRGEDIWCQGFSEPNAGSDLAALATSAVRDGDHYVVNGQKVWNTLGHLADWCELLVRTDPSVAKHKGISCLLVDMTLPGIEVRPLVTITGERSFNEITFTDVLVPADALLGPEHQGWMVAMTTLAFERAGVANLHLGLRTKIAALIELAQETDGRDGRPVACDPVFRQRLAALHSLGESLKLLSDRAVSNELQGRPAGPESSLAKLRWSLLEQSVSELGCAILGLGASTSFWGREHLASRGLTIAGGTTEINKNVIAERMLGLPRG
jgi:alkylation response protein AidB-like acyl-CoA dehydrogenase